MEPPNSRPELSHLPTHFPTFPENFLRRARAPSAERKRKVLPVHKTHLSPLDELHRGLLVAAAASLLVSVDPARPVQITTELVQPGLKRSLYYESFPRWNADI